MRVLFCLAGYDANYMDPLGHMMLGSEDYRYFMQVMQVRQSAAGCYAWAEVRCKPCTIP